MTDHITRLKEALEAGPTDGPWFRNERLNGPFWYIWSDHSVGGKCVGQGRQAVASVHGESKRGATAYAAMFEANAAFIAAANPAAIRELLERLEAAEKDARRYRWLRTRATPGVRPSRYERPLNYSPVRLRVETAVHDPSRWGNDVDAAVDAAIAAQEGSKDG